MTILISSILNAALYRLAGEGGFDNAKLIRRLGCSLVTVGTLFLMGLSAPWWCWVTSIFLMSILNSYFDFIDGTDNYYLHGLVQGLAILPFMVVIPWWLIVARAIVMGLFMGLWCKYFMNVWVEELGRGASLSFTLPILLIGG